MAAVSPPARRRGRGTFGRRRGAHHASASSNGRPSSDGAESDVARHTVIAGGSISILDEGARGVQVMDFSACVAGAEAHRGADEQRDLHRSSAAFALTVPSKAGAHRCHRPVEPRDGGGSGESCCDRLRTHCGGIEDHAACRSSARRYGHQPERRRWAVQSAVGGCGL